jgi:hypothetical protein
LVLWVDIEFAKIPTEGDQRFWRQILVAKKQNTIGVEGIEDCAEGSRTDGLRDVDADELGPEVFG